MADLHEYEYESGGVPITALLTEEDAARLGAKQKRAPRNKAADTGSIRTSSRGDDAVSDSDGR